MKAKAGAELDLIGGEAAAVKDPKPKGPAPPLDPLAAAMENAFAVAQTRGGSLDVGGSRRDDLIQDSGAVLHAPGGPGPPGSAGAADGGGAAELPLEH
eukprot:3278026-Pyramimonas_sp.AAC.1